MHEHTSSIFVNMPLHDFTPQYPWPDSPVMYTIPRQGMASPCLVPFFQARFDQGDGFSHDAPSDAPSYGPSGDKAARVKKRHDGRPSPRG